MNNNKPKRSDRCKCKHIRAAHGESPIAKSDSCRFDGCPCKAFELGECECTELNCVHSKWAKPFEATKPTPLPTKQGDCPICKSHGNSIVRIDGICESCYIKQNIDSIEKEIAIAREVLTNLENAKFMHLGKMREARKSQLTGQKLKFRCEKGCGFEADQMLHLVWHEEKCYHTPTKKAGSPRVAKAPVEPTDEEVGI